MVTDQLVVGHYRAPKVFRPGLVKGVKTAKRGTAPRRALEGRGRRRALRRHPRAVRRPPRRPPGANRSLTLRTTARAKRVTVRAMTAGGVLGR